jgi:5'-deoxynucleotidase YfbR-like HD superfamily hydrolase
MISPFKAVMGGDYKAVEKRIQSAVHMRFGLKPELDVGVLAEIKRCDTIAAYFEAVRLAGFQESEARRFFGRPQPPFAAPDTFGDLQPVPANEAKRLFLDRFGELTEE